MSPFGLKFSQMILHTETSKLMYNWSFLFEVLHKPTLLPSTFKRWRSDFKCLWIMPHGFTLKHSFNLLRKVGTWELCLFNTSWFFSFCFLLETVEGSHKQPCWSKLVCHLIAHTDLDIQGSHAHHKWRRTSSWRYYAQQCKIMLAALHTL